MLLRQAIAVKRLTDAGKYRFQTNNLGHLIYSKSPAKPNRRLAGLFMLQCRRRLPGTAVRAGREPC